MRRYSTDLEIITTADGETVAAWMKQQGHEPKRMAPGIHLCSLTPDGILFVIHDYPPGDFDAADIEAHPFQHFPIEDHPPPDMLDVPLLSLDFLLATKLYAIQERDRGGERKKDAYDLALALTRASIEPS